MITPPRAADGVLILADIGGYTSFLRQVQVAHADDAFAGGNIPDAYAFVASLLDGIVERLIPPFTLAKLEGDAVFAYTESPDALPQGDALLACIRACYAEFARRLAGATSIWTCRCGACTRIDTLDLKFVLHAGPFVIGSIAGAPELAGPEVVMAHRLLKNDAVDVLGSGAYALLTDAVVARLGVPLETATGMTAEYEHYDPIETWLVRLP
ncbi:MAG TPA: DUF2652 domain-containing protein [Candidatus Limnocylindrales bacterium]|nr:DUF2652 domain-containing protein [Candidatus Limnocylindrales bacterium]